MVLPGWSAVALGWPRCCPSTVTGGFDYSKEPPVDVFHSSLRVHYVDSGASLEVTVLGLKNSYSGLRTLPPRAQLGATLVEV